MILVISNNVELANGVIQNLSKINIACPASRLVSSAKACDAIVNFEQELKLVFYIPNPEANAAVETLKRIRDLTTAQIVVLGNTQDKNFILELLHFGADDFISDNDEILLQLQRVVKRVQRFSPPRNEGKLIGVCGVGGGMGVSIVASNIAAHIAGRKSRCALLDFHIEKEDQSVLFNIIPKHTMHDIVNCSKTIDKSLLESCLTKHPSGVELFSMSRSDSSSDTEEFNLLVQICKITREVFSYGVIDLPLTNMRNFDIIVNECDEIHLVIKLNVVSLMNAAMFISNFKSQYQDSKKLRIIVNQTGITGELPMSSIKEALHYNADHTLSYAPENILRSINCGNPVVLEKPKSKFSREIGKIGDAVCKPFQQQNVELSKRAWAKKIMSTFAFNNFF